MLKRISEKKTAHRPERRLRHLPSRSRYCPVLHFCFAASANFDLFRNVIVVGRVCRVDDWCGLGISTGSIIIWTGISFSWLIVGLSSSSISISSKCSGSETLSESLVFVRTADMITGGLSVIITTLGVLFVDGIFMVVVSFDCDSDGGLVEINGLTVVFGFTVVVLLLAKLLSNAISGDTVKSALS